MSRNVPPVDFTDAPSVSSWAEAARLSLANTDAKLSRRFDQGVNIDYLLALRARAIDHLVKQAWIASVPPGSQLSLFAVGGYGRSELFPKSDIDLLVFGDIEAQRQFESSIARFFSQLWDIGLPASHAVRSAAQCTEACANDHTVMTALIEARPLMMIPGAQALLSEAISPQEVWSPHAFFLAKLEELSERHRRFDDTSENLEPNIKEGPGGLRDIQTLGWISQRTYGIKDIGVLVWRGNLGADEATALERERRTLARLRFGLHLVAGRAEERLLFDYQKALARRLGFNDSDGNMAVENMMQTFYRSAAIVRRITDRLLQRFEEYFEGEAPVQPLDNQFALRGDYFITLDKQWPDGDLSNVFDLFSVWAEHPGVKNLHSLTARALAEALPGLPDYETANPSTRKKFMDLLKQPDAVTTLTRLARLGVLASYLPAFSQVSGRMQFDLFHVYTVDQHTLMVLRNINGFASGKIDPRFSLTHEVWPRLRKPELLLLAGLFHDIAKGRNGDHSILGEVDARAFCLAHGLSQHDAELVAWLVRNHLLMSVTAQKQDISDPKVLHAFAERIADREHLDYLYLLTCADIAGTSPTVWNAWKDQLLADLYLATRRILREGHEKPIAVEARIQESKEAARMLLHADDLDDATIDRQFARMPEEGFLRFRSEQLAWQVKALLNTPPGETQVCVRHIGRREDAMEVFVYSPDRDGLFAAIVATLGRMGYGIHQARILLGPQNSAFDNFEVLTDTLFASGDPKELALELRQVLAAPLDRVRVTRRVVPRRLRYFHFSPKIEFQRSANGLRTVMNLTCADRPGLLAEVAKVFRNYRLRVHDARIATFGERVEDLFHITDECDRPLNETTQDQLKMAIGAFLNPVT